MYIRCIRVLATEIFGKISVICVNYFLSGNSVRVLSIADRDWKMLFGSRFSVALLRNLAEFTTEKPEHANAPIDSLGESFAHSVKTLLTLDQYWICLVSKFIASVIAYQLRRTYLNKLKKESISGIIVRNFALTYGNSCASTDDSSGSFSIYIYGNADPQILISLQYI